MSETRCALVTGAGGLIGTALCRALVERGDGVVAVRRTERRATTSERPPDPLTVIAADVRERDALGPAIERYGVDTVYHLAAQSTIAEAARDPLETLEINVGGTCQVLEACRRHGVARVVVASSDKVYGAGAPLPTNEDQPLNARNPYEVSKVAADLLARSYWESFGLPVAVARLSNVYGAGDLNFSRLVPYTVVTALEGHDPRMRSAEGTERDFLHVEDAVSAYIAIAAALDAPAPATQAPAAGLALNVGTGTGTSTHEVARTICRLADTGAQPRAAGEPSAPPDRECIDSARLSALTGWRPLIGLEDGLERTVRWYRDNPWARPA